MRFSDVARVVAGNLACAAAMAGAALLIGWGLPEAMPPLLRLAALVPAGALIYLLLAWLTRQRSLHELRTLGRQVFPGA